jgi:hypothetical protein
MSILSDAKRLLELKDAFQKSYLHSDGLKLYNSPESSMRSHLAHAAALVEACEQIRMLKKYLPETGSGPPVAASLGAAAFLKKVGA